jgi:hypothetical protein
MSSRICHEYECGDTFKTATYRRRKSDTNAVEGFFCGCSRSFKAWRLYIPETGKIIESPYTSFHRKVFTVDHHDLSLDTEDSSGPTPISSQIPVPIPQAPTAAGSCSLQQWHQYITWCIKYHQPCTYFHQYQALTGTPTTTTKFPPPVVEG